MRGMPILSNTAKKRLSYGSILLGLLLILGSQFFAYVNVESSFQHSELASTTRRTLYLTANYGIATKELQSNVRGYLFTEDRKFLSTSAKALSDVYASTDTLLMLLRSDPAQIKRVRELQVAFDEIHEYGKQIVLLFRKEGKAAASERMKEGRGIFLFQNLKRKLDEIDQAQIRQLELQQQSATKSHKRTQLFIVGSGVVGAAITFLSIFLLFNDQRKQQQLQREILKKEQLLSQYLEAIPDGIIVINQDRKITLINQTGRELLQVTNSALSSLDDLLYETPLFNPADPGKKFTSETLPLNHALLGKKLKGNKIDLVKDDKIVHFETNVQPIYDLNGEITGAVTVFRDITDRVDYAENLEKARDLAEKSTRLRDAFLSNISHEIRTPLNAILGFTTLLESEITQPHKVEYIKNIQIAGKNLLDLINDILDVSKIEVGQFQLNIEPISITEVANAVSVLIGQRAREKGIDYRLVLADNLPEIVMADALRLSQILINLCGNAVKFTEKGHVTLSVEALSSPKDPIQTIRFSIEDTGIGIPEDKIEHVFDRFVQASASTTQVFGGTGLGLSIVKALVNLFKGKLDLKSTPGQGSTFTIECPFQIGYRTLSPANKDRTNAFPIQPNSLRLLAAEDNILNQKLLEALFKKHHLSLTIVNNGLDAVNLLKSGSYDLVLMDMQMPIMDGYQAIKEIRTTLNLTVPIISMTAHAMVGEREECLKIGANSYISKPFRENDLFYEITNLTQPLSNQQRISSKNKSMSHIFSSNIADLNYLNELSGEDPQFIQELVNLFKNEHTPQFLAIEDALTNGRADALRKAIHKYRSSLISIGLLNTASAYKEVEKLLTSGSIPADVAQEIRRLEEDVSKGLLEIKQFQEQNS